MVVGAELGLDVIILDELAELHHGEFAGLTNDEISTRYPGVLESRNADKYNWQFPAGESYREAAERGKQALELIDASRAAIPAIVTHEMIGRTMLAALVGLAPADALATNLPHGSVVEVSPATAQFVMHSAVPNNRVQ